MNGLGKQENKQGFTLLEIVVVIALTAMLLATVFQAIGKVKENEARAQQRKDIEKEAYLLFHRLSPLIKNISSQQVFNGRELSKCFRGNSGNLIFLSRSPLLSPFRSLHMVELKFQEHTILYREKEFLATAPNEPVSFESISDQPFYPLLKDVEQALFQYFTWEPARRDYIWSNSLDSYNKGQIPEEIMLKMVYYGKMYQFLFTKIITDTQKEVPGDLFR